MSLLFTYWSGNGTFQTAAEKLQKLIPAEGSVDKPRSANRCLEKYRKAANCYYDLYNNGLYNRVDEFRRVFGIASSEYKYGLQPRYHIMLYVEVEKKMDEIISAAASEQGIKIVADNPRSSDEDYV